MQKNKTLQQLGLFFVAVGALVSSGVLTLNNNTSIDYLSKISLIRLLGIVFIVFLVYKACEGYNKNLSFTEVSDGIYKILQIVVTSGREESYYVIAKVKKADLFTDIAVIKPTEALKFLNSGDYFVKNDDCADKIELK